MPRLLQKTNQSIAVLSSILHFVVIGYENVKNLLNFIF